MPKKTYREAINEALRQEMRRDERVVVIGEDVSGGVGLDGESDAWGGPLGVTKGLYTEFGASRVIDTPITESAIVGMGAGAAATGLRPVVELMFCDFLGVCFDQILNQAAKFRYMFGGKAKTPLVVRTMYGGGLGAAAQHSQCLYQMFTAVPGIKCVVPSNSYDAKGLLIEAIRDDDPVIFFEHKAMYDEAAEVPDEAYTIPFGEASIMREGDDLTIIALGKMVPEAMKAAEALEKDGVNATVLDLRTTSPMDEETILDVVDETGRVLLVDESNPRCSIASDVAGFISSQGFDALKAPIQFVTAPHVPTPFAPDLENLYLPDAGRITEGARTLMGYQR